MGKKLFTTPATVAPDAASTMTETTTTAAMIRTVMRGPDPVRDREGIDIGFLECCRRGPGATGQQGVRRPRTRVTHDGAPDAGIIPDESAFGRRDGAPPERDRVGVASGGIGPQCGRDPGPFHARRPAPGRPRRRDRDGGARSAARA